MSRGSYTKHVQTKVSEAIYTDIERYVHENPVRGQSEAARALIELGILSWKKQKQEKQP